MTEILAVFRSRTQAIDCLQNLKANLVPASLVNTPKEANVGCGLSVKTPESALPRVKRIIAGRNYSSFYGYLKIENKYGRTFILPLK